MTATLATVSYIGATILFILSLGGLSHPESSRRGNLYGMIGMTIAVLATVFGPQVTQAGLAWIVGAMVVGGSIGIYAARSHLGSAIAFRAFWTKAPVLQPLADRAQVARHILAQRPAAELDLAQALRQPLWQKLAEHRFQFGIRTR